MPEGPDVDVVRARLGDFSGLDALRATLTEEERSRAEGFRFDETRGAFILARGLLRLELGRRLGREGGAIRFDLRPSGKPDVRLDGSGPDWRFSVSHTGPHVALAFALGADVGVDIEPLDREVKPLEIAKRYFTPRELQSLEATPEEARKTAFLAGWTRKEAIVKARGLTMAESLNTLSVDLDPLAAHPDHEDAPRAPARARCHATAFLRPDWNLIGAVALCADRAPRLRFDLLSAPRFD